MALTADAITTSTTIWVDPLVILSIIMSVGGVVVACWKVFGRRNKQFNQFFRDWNGENERPGVNRRPGVLERLSAMESQGRAHGEQLTVIHAEVNYNHGGSIKDAVDRMDHRLEGVDEDVKFLKDQNGEKIRRLDSIESTITDLHGKYVERMEGVDDDIRNLQHDRTNITVGINHTTDG